MSVMMRDALTMLKHNTHRQQKIHLHCYTGDLDSYNNWIGMCPKHRVRCHRENNTDGGICTSSSPDGPWSPRLSRVSRHPYDVVGHDTNVAKYRNLPPWVVLRVAALNAKCRVSSCPCSVYSKPRNSHTNVGYHHTHVRYIYYILVIRIICIYYSLASYIYRLSRVSL